MAARLDEASEILEDRIISRKAWELGSVRDWGFSEAKEKHVGIWARIIDSDKCDLLIPLLIPSLHKSDLKSPSVQFCTVSEILHGMQAIFGSRNNLEKPPYPA
jgi:hypothetical protein